MNTAIKVSTLAAALIFGASAAGAWERNTTFTGPNGTGSVNAQGSCSGGVCTSTRNRTGPYGGTTTTNRSGSCAGGVCSGTIQRTGPYGGTTTIQRNGSCSGGVCTRTRTRTGPYGNTQTGTTTWSR